MPHTPPISLLTVGDDATDNDDLSKAVLRAIIVCFSTSSAANMRVPDTGALQSFSFYS